MYIDLVNCKIPASEGATLAELRRVMTLEELAVRYRVTERTVRNAIKRYEGAKKAASLHGQPPTDSTPGDSGTSSA